MDIIFRNYQMWRYLVCFLALFISANARATVADDPGLAVAQIKASCEEVSQYRHSQSGYYTGGTVYEDHPNDTSHGGIGWIDCYSENSIAGYKPTAAYSGYNSTCASRNVTSNAHLTFAGPWPSCKGYCSTDVGMGDVSQTTMVFQGKTVMASTGVMQFSGAICGVGTEPLPIPVPNNTEPDNTDESCQADGVLTQCVKPDGRICAHASNGTEFCWDPSSPPSNGHSDDGSVHVNNTTTPPSAPSGQSVTGTVVNTTTNNSTTGPTTYNSSVSFTGSSSGECASGQTGTPPNCVDAGGVTGGQECGSPPTCTGDAVACYSATQQFQTHCALVKGVTGNGTCGTPYVCTGVDQVACATLKELHKTRCGVEDSKWNGTLPGADGIAGTTGQQFGIDPTVDDVVKTGSIDLTLLNDNGFNLPQSCPVLDFPQYTIGDFSTDIDWPAVCSCLQVLAAIIVIVGYIQAGWILLGIGK